MNQPLVDVVAEFERRYMTDPATADRTLLEAAQPLLQQQLQSSPLDSELVHLAEKLYFFLADKQAIVDLLSRYLTQPLPVDEEARARWELVDNLAMLRRCHEAVETQKRFLAWARQHLPQDRLWWVVYDGTQALCWAEDGKADEWLAISEGLLKDILPTPENRYDRYYLLRSAGDLLNYHLLKRTDNCLQIAGRMHELCDEDPSWDRRVEVHSQAYALEVGAYQNLQDVVGLRRAGLAGTALLQECKTGHPHLNVMCNNLAWPLYRAKQYDLSIPLHRRAMELGTSSEHTYLWLAAALWATTRDRAQALSILKQGMPRCRGNWYKLEGLPEFQDVVDDPEFQDAVKRPDKT